MSTATLFLILIITLVAPSGKEHTVKVYQSHLPNLAGACDDRADVLTAYVRRHARGYRVHGTFECRPEVTVES